ncbi:hypothetical protein [Pseudomonas sp. TWP3-2]|uniref:hypothetical protein n=1 Tax=Pseudomonas sp. TWP3-2 TaxID=2804574 RepID=UPI003CF69CF9
MSTKRSRHDENLEYRARLGLLSKAAYGSDPVTSRDFGYRKTRTAGATLKPGDVPALLAAALASGPIKQGEAFEHFLAVVCDDYRFHAFHFIVAPARVAGGRRRAVMLSERTVNGSVDFGKDAAYAQQLVDYAAALGSPRVIVHALSFCCTLIRHLVRLPSNGMNWSSANLQLPADDEQLRSKYHDSYALTFDRYKQAAISKAIKYPPMEALDKQIARVAPHAGEQGHITLTKPGDRMERELEALCLLCLDEERERLSGASDAELMAG